MEKFNLKSGMYVRVPVDFEDTSGNPRMFAMGQVVKKNDVGNYLIEFNKNFKSSEAAIINSHIPKEEIYVLKDISRCKILDDTEILFRIFESGKVISFSRKNEEGYYCYYVETIIGEIKEISEQDILADFNRCKYDVLKQIENYELHNPFWYVKRSISSQSLNIIKNAARGFDTLISSRTYLYSHQVDTVLRVLHEDKCRIMLADEVGLGKTIEASVILKGLLKSNKKMKSLLIVPEALVSQWKNELDIKFWIKANVWKNRYDKLGQVTIVALEDIEEFYNLDKYDYDLKEFNLCIIDECHRIIGMDKEYSKILSICKKINNTLLLTATPIQARKEEYLKLLKLLDPIKYKHIDDEKFIEIYKKSDEIRKLVYSISKDLDDLDEEVQEDILDDLREIDEILEDEMVSKLIDGLNEENLEKFEEQLRELLAYITNNYQIEKNIIRHRREEINNILPKRKVNCISYEMIGSEENFFERDCYEELISYIGEIKENNTDNKYLGEITIHLLNAMFSSANALEDLLSHRLNYIIKTSVGAKFKEDLTLLNTPKKEESRRKNLLITLNSWKKEKEILNTLLYMVRQWKINSEGELENIAKLIDYPENIKGRLAKLIDYINEEFIDEKLVIFTSWSRTLEVFAKALEEIFGKESTVLFYSKLNQKALDESIYKFQEDESCRFIVCDELGSEGRNFQNAHSIVNIDIPFSPIILEQRIGRLDRIGRNPELDVDSVVIVSNQTLENDLFNLWNDGLNMFSESLSGMEIALDDINKSIINALKSDISYGLKDSIDDIKLSLENIKNQVKRERYYDMARQISRSEKKKFDRMINRFDNANGDLLEKTMLEWARAVGLNCEYSNYDDDKIVYFSDKGISYKSMINTIFDIPNTKVALERSKDPNKIRGTFNREKAIENESLVFFTPGEEIFDSIMRNVEEGYRGKCSAIELSGYEEEWEGFVFTWNSSFGVNELIKRKIDIKNKSLSQGYILEEQLRNAVAISNTNLSENEVLEILHKDLHEAIIKKRVKHLGKRGLYGDLFKFKKDKPSNIWKNEIKEALERSRKKRDFDYKKKLDVNKLKKDFSTKIAGIKFANNFFELDENEKVREEIEEIKRIYAALIEGIKNPNFELDSIIYIKLKR